MPNKNYSALATSISTDFRAAVASLTPNGFNIYVRDGNGEIRDCPCTFTVHDNEPAEVALTTFGDVINYSGAAAWGSVSAEPVIATLRGASAGGSGEPAHQHAAAQRQHAGGGGGAAAADSV